MTVYNTRSVGNTKGVPLDARTWLASHLQVADENTFNPSAQIASNAGRSTLLKGLIRKIGRVFNSLNPYANIPFYAGAHWLVEGKIYDNSAFVIGTISGDNTFTASLHNTSSTSETIDYLFITAEQGVEISGIAEGTVFGPYEEKEFTVTVLGAGRPIFAATISMQFAGNPTLYSFTVSGQRLRLPIPLDANWQDGLTVTRRYLTSVMEASDSSETRKSLRRYPALSMDASLSFFNKNAAAQAWQHSRTRASGLHAIPLYSDETLLTASTSGSKVFCESAYRRFNAGGRALLCKKSTTTDAVLWEFVVVETVDVDGFTTNGLILNTFNAGDRAYPMLVCFPSFGSDSKHNHLRDAGQLDISVTEQPNELMVARENPDLVVDEKHGYPVFLFDVNDMEPTDISVRYAGDIEQGGRSDTFYIKGTLPSQSQTVHLTAFSRAEMWDYLGFFNKIRGRGRAFWMRDHSDFIVTSAISSGYFETDQLEFRDWENLQYLWVESGNDYDIIEISSVAESDNGTRISYTQPSFAPVKFYPALLVRLDTDEITETWITREVAELTFTVRELQGAYDGL